MTPDPPTDLDLTLSNLLERVDLGVVVTDQEQHIQYCNPLVQEYYLPAHHAENWRGRPWRDLLAPLFSQGLDCSRVESGLERLQFAPKGRVEIDHLTVVWNNVSRRTINLVLADLGVNATHSRPGWTAWYLYDVTALREANENIQALLRNSADGIFMIDTDCHMRVFNQACEKITGYRADEVLYSDAACSRIFQCSGKQCAPTHAPSSDASSASGAETLDEFSPYLFEQHPGCIRDYCLSLPRRGTQTHEQSILTRSGERRWVEISYSPVADEHGDDTCVLGILRDITQRRHLEDQLRLTRKLATLGELTSAMAHEIKNPLGIILSSAEIIANPDRPEEQRVLAAEFIREESKRLDERIQIFLKFSRPKPPEFKPQNLHRILTQTIIAYQTLAREQLTVETSFAHHLPHVMVDADQMQQVFLNLLMNADQSMPAGGEIRIRTSLADDGSIEIGVADEGIGLPEGHQQRLFEPFFSTKSKGTGLGLSIVMQIVGAHQGKVSARNRPEGGAEFIVSLPPAPDSPDEPPEAEA